MKNPHTKKSQTRARLIYFLWKRTSCGCAGESHRLERGARVGRGDGAGGAWREAVEQEGEEAAGGEARRGVGERVSCEQDP